ncbi:MAG: hypothetical protein EA397_13945 [Deltaproteobacteria bacterium]|nr:MAG: hypothetical protein EA397_13945 [Deltaproteobacteria bacterium]
MIHRLPALLLGLLAPLLAVAGEPVFLPDFTPTTTSDFSLAMLLQQAAVDELNKSGHVVLQSEAVESIVGPTFGCIDDADCPIPQLKQLPARFAVVVGVRRTSGGRIITDIELHEVAAEAVLERRTVEIVDGREGLLGREIADMVTDLASVMGPADGSALVKAGRILADFEAASAPAPSKEPADTRPARPRPNSEPLSDDARIEQALDETDFELRHLEGVRQHFLDRDLDIRDWNYQYAPHAGRVIIEVRGGFGIGDADRIAFVRTRYDDQDQEFLWFLEGPAQSQRLRGELYVGYAPSAWVDIGVLMGLQYGERELNSGWNTPAESDSGVDRAQAVQFHVQPRVRFYPVRTGPFKPYLVGGVDVRFFDRWRLRPPPNVRYQPPPGGVAVGPSGGLGFLIDPSPIVGFFVEGTITSHLTERGYYFEFEPPNQPANADDLVAGRYPAGYLIVLAAGVQFRL